MSVTAGQGDSGFHGYSYQSLYPGLYQGVKSQTEETVPEPEEQAVLAGVDDPAPATVDSKSKIGILALIGALLVLLFFFGRG